MMSKNITTAINILLRLLINYASRVRNYDTRHRAIRVPNCVCNKDVLSGVTIQAWLQRQYYMYIVYVWCSCLWIAYSLLHMLCVTACVVVPVIQLMLRRF